jgi:ELWxxDGT repeat protein
MKQLRNTFYAALLCGVVLCGCSKDTSGISEEAGDATSPGFSVSPAQGSTLGSVTQVTVAFTESVKNAGVSANYALGGTGKGTLAITSVTTLSASAYRLNFSGTPADGVLSIQLGNITDTAGNALSGNLIYFVTDVTNPTLTSVPAAGVRVAALSQLDVTFSRAVTGATTAANYVVSGAGAGTVSVSGITSLGGNAYRVSFAGAPGNGALNINVNGIQDSMLRGLSGNIISLIGDITLPTWSANPATGNAVSSLASVDITFSEAVSNAGVTAGYSLSGSGVGTLTLTQVFQLTATSYRLVFSGAPITGTLNLAPSAITDTAGNALSSPAITWTGDLVNPTFNASPADSASLKTLTQIVLTFSKPVTGATTTANYVLSGAGKGTLASSSVTSLGGNVYRLNLTGSIADGPLHISLNNIRDGGNNALGANGLTYYGDTTPPTQASVPGTGSTVGALPQIDITFSEPVLNAAVAGNYALSGAGTGTLAVVSANNIGGNTYRVVFSGASGDGPVQISLNGITDAATNNLSVNTIALTTSTQNPTLTATPVDGSTVKALAYADITFSKAVIGASTAANYTVSGAGAGTLSVTSAALRSGNTYRLVFSGAGLSGPVALTLQNITDATGLPLAGNTINYTYDAALPTVVATPANGANRGSLANLTLAFSEPVQGATVAANYTLSGAGKGTLALLSVTPSGGNTYNLSFSGAPANGSLTLTLGTIRDLAGNPLFGNALTYMMDITQPSTTASPAAGSPINSITQMDITFSEIVTGADNLANYSLSGAGVGTLSISAVVLVSGTTYRLTFSGVPADGPLNVNVANVLDLAGNPLGASAIGFTGDISVPTVSDKWPALSQTNIGTDMSIRVLFSEPILASSLTTSTFLVNNGAGNIAGTLRIINPTEVMFQPTAAMQPNTTHTVTLTTGIKDAPGLPMAANYSWTFTTRAGPAVQKVKNYTAYSNSYYKNLVRSGNSIFFARSEPATGLELWKTDGTAAGTTLVKDIFAGPNGTTIECPVDVNGVLFFFATNGINGKELWKSDGTAAGTVMVKDINPGPGDGYFSICNQYTQGANNNGVFYFAGYDPTNGNELWKSDGTAAGTVLIKDIYPGLSGGIYGLTAFNGKVYFKSCDTTAGCEMWMSDGTAAGTSPLKDIYPGTAHGLASNQVMPTIFGGALYFGATSATAGGELWKSDGTTVGTVQVEDLNPGFPSTNPGQISLAAGRMFFVGAAPGFFNGLWVTDGTVGGSTVLTESVLVAPFGTTTGDVQILSTVGANVFFIGSHPDASGGYHRFYFSDGTKAGTHLVKIIRTDDMSAGVAFPIAYDNRLIFMGTDVSNNAELWSSDGTSFGTYMLREFVPGNTRREVAPRISPS